MAFLYNYMTDDERENLISEAAIESESNELHFMFENIMIDHEERIRDIDIECIENNYTEFDLEKMYEKEMEVFLEGVTKWWGKFKQWVGGIVDAIMNKQKDTQAQLEENKPQEDEMNQVVELPIDPEQVFKTAERTIIIVNNVNAYQDKEGKVDNNKVGKQLGIKISAGAIGPLITTGLMIAGGLKIRKKVKELLDIKSRGIKTLQNLKNAIFKRKNPDNEAESKQASVIQQITSPIIKKGNDVINMITSKIPNIHFSVKGSQNNSQKPKPQQTSEKKPSTSTQQSKSDESKEKSGGGKLTIGVGSHKVEIGRSGDGPGLNIKTSSGSEKPKTTKEESEKKPDTTPTPKSEPEKAKSEKDTPKDEPSKTDEATPEETSTEDKSKSGGTHLKVGNINVNLPRLPSPPKVSFNIGGSNNPGIKALIRSAGSAMAKSDNENTRKYSQVCDAIDKLVIPKLSKTEQKAPTVSGINAVIDSLEGISDAMKKNMKAVISVLHKKHGDIIKESTELNIDEFLDIL